MDPSSSSPSSSSSSFRRIALITITLTYVLISVGAIVRVSGAGMGCPDWPRCFGLLIPPMSVDELPPPGSYTYPAGWSVDHFDPVMTWIEFLNRMLGALVGFAILATLISAIRWHRRRPAVLLPVIGAFVGVLYAAWLGGRVVAHELAPWIVTVHLLSAIAVVSLLVIAAVNATTTTTTTPEGIKVSRLVWAAAGLALVQGAIGTQVRGILEDVARAHPELARGSWIEHVGLLDPVHRTLALAVVAAVVVVFVVVRKQLRDPLVLRAATAALVLVIVQMVVGVVLTWAALPKPMQVFHLLAGALLLGALTTTAMLARRSQASWS
ncbi:MAG: COX15/CtaA family protein [Deltaproteobacteria bacterium]|nr:COX15/CtaA family protein [Deltaproteobacteria bacterium]